jgi:hypothetical protein
MSDQGPNDDVHALFQSVVHLREQVSTLHETVAMSIGANEMAVASATMLNAADEMRRLAPPVVGGPPVPGTREAIIEIRAALGQDHRMPTYARPITDIPPVTFIGEVIPPAMASHDGAAVFVLMEEQP